MCSLVPVLWAKGSGRLSMAWHLLHDLQEVGTNHRCHLRNQKDVWPSTTRGLWTGSSYSPSLKRSAKNRALQPRTTHRFSHSPGNKPYCCWHCQMLRGLPTHAWSLSLPRTLQLGAACSAPPAWAKWDRVCHVWSTGGRHDATGCCAKNMLLKNQWVNEEIKKEIKKCFQKSDNEDTTNQNLWDATKAVFRGKLITIQPFLKKNKKNFKLTT